MLFYKRFLNLFPCDLFREWLNCAGFLQFGFDFLEVISEVNGVIRCFGSSMKALRSIIPAFRCVISAVMEGFVAISNALLLLVWIWESSLFYPSGHRCLLVDHSLEHCTCFSTHSTWLTEHPMSTGVLMVVDHYRIVFGARGRYEAGGEFKRGVWISRSFAIDRMEKWVTQTQLDWRVPSN